MFTELAFIDWIALAFAAVLLAGAAAAAVLAYVTSRARTSVPKSGYAHAATVAPVAHTTTSPGLVEPQHVGNAKVFQMSDHEPRHASNDATDQEEQPTASFEEPSVIPMHAAIPLPASSSAEPLTLSFARSTDEAEVLDLAEQATNVDAEAMSVIDITTATSSAAPLGDELEDRRASRAARLRGRPIAEVAGASDVTNHGVYSSASPDVMTASAGTDTAGQPERVGFSTRSPGFFEDPMGRHELRYWDGSRWTEYVKERGERFTDPL